LGEKVQSKKKDDPKSGRDTGEARQKTRKRRNGRVKESVHRREIANLPAGFERKASDGHAVDGTARTGRSALLLLTVLAGTSGATSELDDETLAHEVGTI
jgi:hypothetical protein